MQHDRDSKFSTAFDECLKQAGSRIAKAAHYSPNTVTFVERFIQSLKQECLDYFYIFGERHMNYLCAQWVDYYHAQRTHQGRNNELLVPGRVKKQRKKKSEADLPSLADIRCKQRLGGLLKHYYRQAA